MPIAAPTHSGLVICTSTEIGGMERLALGIARQLKHQQWQVEVVFAGGPGEDQLMFWASQQGVEATTSKAVRTVLEPSRSWRSVLELAKFIRAHNAEVVNFHYGGSHVSLKDVLAARLAGARVVANLHLPVAWEKSGRRKRLVTGVAARLCSAVVVHSQAVEEVVAASGVPTHKLHLVPPGLPVPARVPREQARRRFGLSDSEFVVGSMARMVPHKGMADLIRSFARLDPANSVLILAGDGPERPALEQLAEQLAPGRVRFAGWISDAAEFFAALDIFALPSHLEGFGLVFVEAAFQGVPGVGYDIPGVNEAVAAGETGTLVPDGDIDALLDALSAFAATPALRATFGEQAAARAEALFSEEAMGARQERVMLALPREPLSESIKPPAVGR